MTNTPTTPHAPWERWRHDTIERAASVIAAAELDIPWADLVRQYPDDADWYRSAARALAAAGLLHRVGDHRSELDEAGDAHRDRADAREAIAAELRAENERLRGERDRAVLRAIGVEETEQVTADHLHDLYDALGWPGDLAEDDAIARAVALRADVDDIEVGTPAPAAVPGSSTAEGR